MHTPIHLQSKEQLVYITKPKRLNLFAGRGMSEAAFDKSQNYVIERVSPLLSGVWPGIQQGLDVDYLSVQVQMAKQTPRQYLQGQLTKMAYANLSPMYPVDESLTGFHSTKKQFLKIENEVGDAVEEGGNESLEPLFQVKKGRAVTASGTVVKLFNPLEIKWSDLLERSNLSLQENVNGLYMLCIGTEILPVDYNEAPACRRSEADPMRDTRFETLGFLQLLPVENFLFDLNDLEKKSRHKTINRFLAQFVAGNNQPVLPMTMTTLGLVSVVNKEPMWFESSACRFQSQSLSFPLALLSHTEQVFKELVDANKEKKLINLVEPTKNIFSVLPAAGSLPRKLLSNVANIDAPLPKFEIDYMGLRVDMLPVPVSGVAGVLRRELARGVIDFSVSSKDRLRLLIAVPDGEYRSDLLDVPISDAALSAQVYDYGIKAYSAWLSWHKKLELLYSKNYDKDFLTSEDERNNLAIPDLTLPQFNAPISPRNPNLDMQNLPLNPSEYADGFFDEIINKRGLKTTDNYMLLPPPYRQGVPNNEGFDQWLEKSGMHLPEAESHNESGLIISRAEIEKNIELRLSDLDKTNRFIDGINDLLLLQRQQLDSQTVSFATFAGGVAGDGSGLQITRWLPFTAFEPNTEVDKPQSPPPVSVSATPYYASVDNSFYKPNYNFSNTSFKVANIESALNLKPTLNLKSVGAVNNPAFLQIAKGFPIVDKGTSSYGVADNFYGNSFGSIPGSISGNFDKLIQIPPKNAPLSSGQFQPANIDFGVLSHVSVIKKEFDNSHTAVTSIQDEIDALVAEIHDFIETLPETIKNKLAIKPAINYLSYIKIDIQSLIPTIIDTGSDEPDDSLYYDAFFQTSRKLIKEISMVDHDRNKIIKIQKTLKKYIVELKKDSTELAEKIYVEKNNLIQLDAIRRESLEDYSVAQRLLIEHWKAVEVIFIQRNKILNGMLGLYYVKVRETASSVVLPEKLSLSYAQAGDLVPGCRGDEQVTLSEALSVFMDTLLDVPMAHWQTLSAHIYQLPSQHSLRHMLARRKPRIESKKSQLLQNLNSSIRGFSALQRQSVLVFQSFTSRQFKATRSLRQLQLDAANILSLEDLQNNSAGGRLRRMAQQLSNNVELACFCLLEKLNDLPPSIRLLWAQLAEDDHLPIDSPNTWPDISKAETVAFNSLRTTLELVNWLNRQLIENADGDSRSAMRNMVRACLMLAASDDPGDLLEGELQVAPKTLRLGSVLRLRLNQEAVPGATLQLLDVNKKTVAMLRLDDQDNEGVSATVINLFEDVRELNTQQFMVIGNKYRNV